MSRSNPQTANQNPAEKFFEWKGSEGSIVYYDKEAKENIKVPSPFKFLVLDELSTVVGYNKKAKSGVYSNEVRDTRSDILTVKLFNGEEIAQGLWNDIKEKVNFKKGSFATSCYIAFREDGVMKMGNLRISGCALGPWIDFKKKNREGVQTKAVSMVAGPKDTSGDVEFIPPEFSIIEISKEADEQAKVMDRSLQEYLKGYLARGVTAQGTDVLPGEEPLESLPTYVPPLTEPDDEDLNKAIPKDSPKKQEDTGF